MAVLDTQERAMLEQADAQMSDLQHALEAAARSRALDRAVIERLYETARTAALRVNQRLPPQVDADARDEIRRRLIDLLTLSRDQGDLLDLADRALIEAEAVRHVLRDILQEQPPADLRDARSVVELIDDWLPGLTAEQRAELLGVSTRQVQRLRHGRGRASTHRMQLVARLVAILRHAWTDQGVHAWFHRPRRELGGATPLEVIDDPLRERDLLLAARAGRVQGGI
jgi:hypothetical protein